MDNDPLKILLVEDDEDDAFFIKDLIREDGPQPRPEVRHIDNGPQALEILKSEDFDLCMFDYRLGSIDGIDLLKQVRDQGFTLPIIFLTGQGDQETAVRAMKSGANDYLTKYSLTAEILFQSIRFAVQLKKQEDLRRHAELALKQSHQDLQAAHAELKGSMKKLQNAQNQLVRSEKLAGVGRLAAGVCHEILNPLNIISGHVQALGLERENDEPLNEDLNSIMEEIYRIEKIIGGLLKFSRKDDVELKICKINDELESVLSITEREMQLDGVNVERKLQEDLPELEIDANRMRQVFFNLINNARQAMDRGGTLQVTTQMVKTLVIGDRIQKIPVEPGKPVEGDCFIQIRFTDTGSGIKPEHLDKLFEPFFTTKPEDKGTGLGLSVCYSIVEKHNGSLEVESEEGKGATFIIDLPVAARKISNGSREPKSISSASKTSV